MTTANLTDSSENHGARDFFLARQPILNRHQKLEAYELLFRSAAAGSAGVTNDLEATAGVIEHASELGLANVIGTSTGFVNVDANVLMSDFIQFLPREKVVLEILETVQVTDQVVARVSALVQAGYRFALDDVVADSVGLRRLMPLIDVIKIDILGMQKNDLTALCQQFKNTQKKMLAEKVESLDEFKFCFDLGFDYFQGYYFAKPIILSGRKLSSSQVAIMRLMNLIIQDAETDEIEKTIKQDASLGLNLMRLVNTPAFMTRQRIASLRQALTILGRKQLQRWLQILLYATPGQHDSFNSPLLTLATTRGKLLELIAQRVFPRNPMAADIAFTVGIMSLMDALFGTAMDQILLQFSVTDEVANALLHRQGIYGMMLQLAECIERMQDSSVNVHPALNQLLLNQSELLSMQLQAFAWSDSIAQGLT